MPHFTVNQRSATRRQLKLHLFFNVYFDQQVSVFLAYYTSLNVPITPLARELYWYVKIE
jgi:hypothetical protein